MFTLEDISIKNFKEIFKKIVSTAQKAGINNLQIDPPDLLERAKPYGIGYKNGSWGWSSNIWHRSAAGSQVIEEESDLKIYHKKLMLRALEHIFTRPLIQVDTILGAPQTPVAMNCRLYCDSQFPDIAYRWKNLTFPPEKNFKPDAELFFLPHYLNNPQIPNSEDLLCILRFPNYWFSLVTLSSYQGECKKGFLSHWIHYVYLKGGTGEHASLKEFTVKKFDGSKKRIVMCVWGLTGSGKSTHGLYVFTPEIANIYKENFGVNPLDFIEDQIIKNDDVVAVFKDRVYCSEKGSWTKTEDVNPQQAGIYSAAISPHALHENTEWDETGNVSFQGKLFQYQGKPNQNARTVLRLEDTGYYDNIPYSSGPLNMAVFISPGYVCDYAWLKINDCKFAAKVLADGRTTGHPAQSLKGVGQEKYESRYCLPFTMGTKNSQHIHRFYNFIQERKNSDNPVDVYLINTTGRIGTEYLWQEGLLGEEKIEFPNPKFQEVKGKISPVGGTGPSIQETEFFLVQAARGVVKYEPHPFWGDKVLVPVEVPGISAQRLKQFNPFTYRSSEEMEKLLKTQIKISKFYLNQQCAGLSEEIYQAMDF